MSLFGRKRILITGGTGSLGKILVRRLLSGDEGRPEKIIIFSRDEAKQHDMRLEYQHKKVATDEVIYNNFHQLVEFRIGDVRDYESICSAMKDVDMVINAAALKQVPSCEYFPFEAVKTNIIGSENIVRVLREHNYPIETVVGISTDKACQAVSLMGMTKAVQERIFISANILVPNTRFICIRYGNVLASRGSIIPLLHQQILDGGPVTITAEEMTRFLLPLEQAVDVIFEAIRNANRGEIYIPKIKSSLIMNIAKALIGKRKVDIKVTGIRPGEKMHEVLISQEEAWYTVEREGYYVVKSFLPELTEISKEPFVSKGNEYSSGDSPMDFEETLDVLKKNKLMIEDNHSLFEEELLR
ncbi:MAG: polysaccharide biosynthesis protein [Candidatus Berkelbacteria bacterium]